MYKTGKLTLTFSILINHDLCTHFPEFLSTTGIGFSQNGNICPNKGPLQLFESRSVFNAENRRLELVEMSTWTNFLFLITLCGMSSHGAQIKRFSHFCFQKKERKKEVNPTSL